MPFNSLTARAASLKRHSRCDSREATAPARRAWNDRFENEVDPHGVLTPDERARRAALARRAYMLTLAEKSARTRRARKASAA